MIQVLNTVACLVVLGMLICRLNRTTQATQPRVRAQMVLLVLGISAHALLPWCPWPAARGAGAVVLTLCLAVFLWLGRHRWHQGAPIGTVR